MILQNALQCYTPYICQKSSICQLSIQSKFSCKIRNVANSYKRWITFQRPALILGIETSCDDSGCAIVNNKGEVLGESHHSQHLIHLKHGGILPPLAMTLHKQNLTKICEIALKAANLQVRNLDAIAVTTKPGLPLSLLVGLTFAKYLSRKANKPLIPIHHMEAHALTARSIQQIDYPFLSLLISGGHSLLVLVNNVDEFYVLGNTLDNAVGEVFDKIARQLKLTNMPEYSTLSGGQAIENAAKKATDPKQFIFSSTMNSYKNCMFSFSGIRNNATRFILREEKAYNIEGDKVIPSVYNLCASFQLAVALHLCHRTQRAMQFLDENELIPKDKRALVISGGSASNDFLAKALSILSSEMNYKFVRTPPRLCTDNGVMVAWNGMERWMANAGVIKERTVIESCDIQPECPLGVDWTGRVEEANIKCKWVKIEKQLFQNN
ncbi:tRNA N6-adenosine threonylcarbamoyltransferase, mitochondrial [Prorops nasuta]|uniref:tRNA N6-adenosine threonylcarbamoyltransferase, mitochondrial n=1 Tax=Prorops nasuta TaxID=863751 RepID=UPI0034CD3403